jgi:ADP-ribosyl-[dinitrogen reductase] hydrolase
VAILNVCCLNVGFFIRGNVLLVEIAIGDAYGAGFEFCDREKIIQCNTLAGYVPHELGIAAGSYTDDTQMSIAVSEVLLSKTEMSSSSFADAYVRCYRRDRRKGYAKGLQELLECCGCGAALRQRIRPESRRNGAAMRSVPLGLIADKNLLALAAREQAVVTHNTVEGVLSSQVVALMAHFVLYDQAALIDIPELVKSSTGFELMSNWSSEVECDAIQTLHAVNTALLRNRSMSSLLCDCVNFGGDVDSVAAIAMGIASLTPEYASDLPVAILDGLEDGEYGRNFLTLLDAALAKEFPVIFDRVMPNPDAGLYR